MMPNVKRSAKSVTQPCPNRMKAAQQKIRDLLARRRPWLQMAEDASWLPDCEFHREWELGPTLPLPEYGMSRSIVQLLAARAILESDRGTPEAAMRTLTNGARIARH